MTRLTELSHVIRSARWLPGIDGTAREAFGIMTTTMSETIVAVGLEAIGQGIGADDRAAWQVQVGVTRVGSGGRALPRCRNGRMTSPEAIVTSTIEPVEPQEFVTLPRRARKIAPLARVIAFLTVVVVVSVEIARRWFSVPVAIGRVVKWAGATLGALGALIVATVRPGAKRRYCYCCA